MARTPYSGDDTKVISLNTTNTMTFTVNYKYNNLVGTKQLTELLEQKLESLQKFIKEGSAIVCDVEFEKVGAHQNGKVHRIEVNLSIDGTLHRAEATEESFEEAIDAVRNELSAELSRAKDKQVTLDKAAGRSAKELLLQSEA